MKSHLKSTYTTIFQSHQTNPVFGHILSERGFVFQYDEDERDCDLVFVGINPSFNQHEPLVKYSDAYTREGTISYFQAFINIHNELKDKLKTKYTN